MVRKFLFLLFILTALSVSAQDKTINKNIIYGEITSDGTDEYNTLTLNYERVFIQKKFVNFYGRLGAGIWHMNWYDSIRYNDLEVLVGGGAFIGKKSHHLDLQVGLEFARSINYEEGPNWGEAHEDGHKLGYGPYGFAGYRYQKPGQGFMFRIGVGSYGYGSLSMGYSF